MRPLMSCWIICTDGVNSQYFSGTGLSQMAFWYTSSTRRIQTAPGSSFQCSTLAPGYAIS